MKFGIISDIHEDITHLKRAITILKQKTDEIICLGDIVGFSIYNQDYVPERDASACLDIIRENCKYIIAGNHDLYASAKLSAYHAGIEYPDGWFGFSMQEKMKTHFRKVWLYDDELKNNLTKTDIEFIAMLPEIIKLETFDLNILISHFIYPDISGSTTKHLTKNNDLEAHLKFIEENGCKLGFIGHTHVEGHAIGYINKLSFKPFGEFKLKEKLQIVALPCITSGSRKNGFTIFDSQKRTLEIAIF